MTPSELADYLRVLREAGTCKAHISFGHGPGSTVIAVTLQAPPEPPAPPTTPFVDENGQPVSLDEGMPDLADESAEQKIHARNFKHKPAP